MVLIITAILLDKTAILPLLVFVPTTAFQVVSLPAEAAIRAIRAGLPVNAFDGVAKVLSLTIDELATKLGMSPRTVRDQRRRPKARLSREYSEKLVRIARVQSLARNIFSTDNAVAEWLSAPAPALHGAKPIDFLDTDTGAREVESILYGIAHGNVM